jgi:hypothetical protein
MIADGHAQAGNDVEDNPQHQIREVHGMTPKQWDYDAEGDRWAGDECHGNEPLTRTDLGGLSLRVAAALGKRGDTQ